MKRPSFQFYPDDWTGNSKLRRCTHEEKGIWMDVMCILHDQEEYGIVRWPAKELALAVGCTVAKLKGLINKGVLKGADSGQSCDPMIFVPRSGRRNGAPVTLIAEQNGPIWYSSRMVEDEYKRMVRGGEIDASNYSPNHSPKRGLGEGIGAASKASPNPSPFSCARGRPSPSPSTDITKEKVEKEKSDASPTAPPAEKPKSQGTRLDPDFVMPQEWHDWALRERPDLTVQQVQRIADSFKDFWISKAGAAGRKVDWAATWRNWVRNERQTARTATPTEKFHPKNAWDKINQALSREHDDHNTLDTTVRVVNEK